VPAERGLSDEGLLRRAPEVQLLGERDEVAELAEVELRRAFHGATVPAPGHRCRTLRLVTYGVDDGHRSGLLIDEDVVDTATVAEAAKLDSGLDWTSNRVRRRGGGRGAIERSLRRRQPA